MEANRMRRAALRLSFMLCLVFLVGCGSQHERPPQSRKVGDIAQVTPRRMILPETCEVPFNLVNNIPVVDVRVNGHGPFRFVVDTGVTSIILSRSLVRQLGLPRVNGVSGDLNAYGRRTGPLALFHVTSVEVGRAEFQGIDALPLDLSSLLSSIGGVDGVLGLSVFKECVLTLDYPRRVIVLGEVGPARRASSNVCSLRWRDTHTADVPVRIGERPYWLQLDTGSSQGVTVTEGVAAQLNVDRQQRESVTLATFVSQLEEDRMPLRDDIWLGDSRIEQPFVTVGPLMLLGGEILREFVVSIDQCAGVVAFVRPDEADDGS